MHDQAISRDFCLSLIDMMGIDIEVAYHILSIDLNVKSIQQKKRNHGAEWQKVIEEKLVKLL